MKEKREQQRLERLARSKLGEQLYRVVLIFCSCEAKLLSFKCFNMPPK